MKLFKYGITIFDCVENTKWNKFACRVSNIDYLDISLTKKFQVGYTPYYYDGQHYILSFGFISVCMVLRKSNCSTWDGLISFIP